MLNREGMINYLTDHTSYRRVYKDYYPLAWNVKMHFDIDWTGWTGENSMPTNYNEGLDHKWDNRWNEFCEKHNSLFEWLGEEMWEYSNMPDAYESSASGINSHWVFNLVGRSGGWLVLARWNDHKLVGMSSDDFGDWLDDLSDQELHYFYESVVGMDKDFSPPEIAKMANLYVTFIRARKELEWEDDASREAKRMARPYLTGEAMG